MEKQKHKTILDEMESMNLVENFHNDDVPPAMKEYILVRNLVPITIIYVINYLSFLRTTTDTYVQLMLWNLYVCFLLSCNTFLYTIKKLPYSYNIAEIEFIKEIGSDQFTIRYLALILFAPCCLYIGRHAAKSISLWPLRYLFKILILVFSISSLYTFHYGICWGVLMLHLWLISRCYTMFYCIFICTVIYIMGILLRKYAKRVLDKWEAEEDNMETSVLYQRSSSFMRNTIYCITYISGKGTIIMFLYLIFTNNNLKNLSELDSLMGSFSNIKKTALSMIFYGTNNRVVNF
ncbi:hypothetical protein NEFER03_1016 [Nematocida sp. LUAm3]|nr:hypothetical protein NEFER03_1016 [Nematocida sp. LUAm3]KAI5175380.1 hypothetical protein NEFER02_1309 [Nematocida sp. LUAm2]KAI5177663.1 hypothetical protein NEFER01_0887 [Nematocida sp. LUAm1]